MNEIDKKELRTIPEIAKIIGKTRAGIYNKLRYGLSHEIKDGNIYTSLEWLEKYDSKSRRGRRAKERK